jgi:hypothetical protein
MTAHGIEARKKRWIDFLSAEQPPSHMFLIAYPPDDLQRPQPWPDKKAERIEWSWQTYRRQLARAEWLRDDSIPFLDPYTGTEIFAEAFGCKVHRPEDNMPFALPLIQEASEVSRLKVPDVGSSPLAMLFEIADELRRRAGNGAVMRLVDIQSAMDIAALIWDKNRIFTAMIDTPDAVKELAAKVRQLLIAFLDEWFARYGTDFIAHYPTYYMPGGMTLSEDEVGSVNGEMFEWFFLPELVELSQRYGGIGIHCCANARHQWGNFCRIPGLRLLNLVQPEDELRAAYRFYARRVGQMHSWCGDGPPWTWPAQYPEGARVVLQATASSQQEAIELSDELWAGCGRG